jgi:hypothetical protein
MPRLDLHKIFSHHLGNHRLTSVAQVQSFPGLSVDNIASTPQGVASGALGQVGSSGSGGVDSQVASLSKQLGDLKTVQQTQLDKLNANTLALQQNTASKSTATSSGSGALGSLASDLFGGALGIAPIIKGIVDLFSSNTPVQPLVPFSLPASIQYEGALNGTTGSVSTVDNGQGGQPRILGGGGSQTAQASPNVTIQVNAMDTQSFLDRSDDIARAVRQALLNSSSLNDVIADL